MNERDLHDDAKDWAAGPNQPRHWPLALQASPEAPGDERARCEAEWAITAPPLLGASEERQVVCYSAILRVLIHGGLGAVKAKELAHRIVRRLGECLE